MKTITFTEEEIEIMKTLIEGIDYDRWGFEEEDIKHIDNIYDKLE